MGKDFFYRYRSQWHVVLAVIAMLECLNLQILGLYAGIEISAVISMMLVIVTFAYIREVVNGKQADRELQNQAERDHQEAMKEDLLQHIREKTLQQEKRVIVLQDKLTLHMDELHRQSVESLVSNITTQIAAASEQNAGGLSALEHGLVESTSKNQQAVESLQNQLRKLEKDVIAGHEMVAEVQRSCGNLSERLEHQIDSMNQSVTVIVEKMETESQKTAHNLDEKLNMVRKESVDLIGKQTSEMRAMQNDVLKEFSRAEENTRHFLDTANQKNLNLLADYKHMIELAFTTIDDMLNQSKADAITRHEAVRADLIGMERSLRDEVGRVKEKIQAGEVENRNRLEKIQQQLLEEVKHQEKISQQVKDDIHRQLNAMKSLHKESIRGLEQNLRQELEDLRKDVPLLKQEFIEKISGLRDDLGKQLTGIAEESTERADQINEQVEALVQQIHQLQIGTEKQQQAYQGYIQEQINSCRKELSVSDENIQQKIQNSAESIWLKTEQRMNDLQAAVLSAEADNVAGVQTEIEKLNRDLVLVQQDIPSIRQEIMESVELSLDEVRKVLTDINGEVRKQTDNSSERFETISQKIVLVENKMRQQDVSREQEQKKHQQQISLQIQQYTKETEKWIQAIKSEWTASTNQIKKESEQYIDRFNGIEIQLENVVTQLRKFREKVLTAPEQKIQPSSVKKEVATEEIKNQNEEHSSEALLAGLMDELTEQENAPELKIKPEKKEAPQKPQPAPNRIEEIKDEKTGDCILQTYEKNQLVKSVIMKGCSKKYEEFYFDNGTRKRSVNYDDKGKMLSELEYHPNGEVKTRIEYPHKKGMKDKVISHFDVNGKKLK